MIQGAVYNVLDYGADSTGSTDSTTQIQAALDAAFNAGGGLVFVPAGTYKTNKPLIVRSNTILEGTGASSKIVQTANFNGPGNVIHIGYGYEWNQNGQAFSPSSNDDATMAQLLANNFTKLTTRNAGVRNIYIEGYINGNRPGLGVWFMNAFECFCDHIWAKNTLVPVTVANDAIGWQAGCANISVSDIWQVSCDPTTGGLDSNSFSWFDLMFMGSAVYVQASRLFNNPSTPAALNNKIQTAGTCYFTISESVFYGKYADADVGIGINSNNVTAVVGANITGCTFVRCTTGVGLFENDGNSVTDCSISGNIFRQCYIGIDTVGATNGDHNIGRNLYIDNAFADVVPQSYTNYTNKQYAFGYRYLNTTSNVTNTAVDIIRWNSSDARNGAALVDDDVTAVGRFAQQYIRAGNLVGSVQTTLTATAYVTSSDYRLKYDIEPMQNALETVAKLNPVTYKWKQDNSIGQGFIAHELQSVVPDCVSGEKDAVDANGNPQYQGIDTSFLVAVLTAAIKELKAEFDAYKTIHP